VTLNVLRTKCEIYDRIQNDVDEMREAK